MRATIAILILVSGCTDFDLPSALTREQIVAVRSTPASLAPGGRARLDALIAGPDGVVEDAELTWSITEPSDGASIEVDDEGTWLQVADDIAPGPVGITLAVTAPSGTETTALKQVDVGEPRDNPGPMGLMADGQSIADDELRVPVQAAIPLSAQVEGADDAQFSWYATVGEIELYRRNPTELVAPEAPEQGWLITVVRDGEGGVNWQIVSLVVE
jgi:hypothetical protein